MVPPWRVTHLPCPYGMVNVTATASETGSTKQMRVEASSNLSRGEVESLKFDAASGEDADTSPTNAQDGRLGDGPQFEYDEEDDLDVG